MADPSRTHTMGKFISHESLANGIWNRDHCTALPTMSTWAAELTNTNEILLTLCDRLETDFISQNVKMRKAYSGKDVAAGQSLLISHGCSEPFAFLLLHVVACFCGRLLLLHVVPCFCRKRSKGVVECSGQPSKRLRSSAPRLS